MTDLDYLRECLEKVSFIPYPWDGEDQNLAAFRSKEEFVAWYCQPPGVDGQPYCDRGFYCRELAYLSRIIEPSVVVELGTSLGIGTCLLGWLNPGARLVTVDVNAETFLPGDVRVPVGHLAHHERVSYTQVIGNSWDYCDTGVGLCFIDAEHTYEGVKRDSARAWLNRALYRWAIAWHDHNERHPGVMRAVAEFCTANGLTLQSMPDSDTVWVEGGPITSMTPWQAYLLDHFRREDYVSVPEFARDLSGMWRHATWDTFFRDTVECWGTQMATLLSMVYRPKVVAEFGIDAGLTTLQFCKLNPAAVVYGVDRYSRNQVTHLPMCFHAMMNNVTNLNLVLGRPSWEFALPGQVGLCFIDGDHTGDAPWLDSLRAWENRDQDGDWCIAWDDYHSSNPDVIGAVNRFVAQVGMELHQVGSWYYIGTLPHSRLAELGCTT